MKQNRNVSCLNQNKTKLNYVIKFSLIECSLFITNGICLTNVDLLVQDIKSFLLFYAVKRKRDFQLEMYVMAEGRPRYKYHKKCSKFLSRNSHKIPKFLLNLV